MKSLIAVLALTITANVFAANISFVLGAPFLTTTDIGRKAVQTEAVVILNDFQDYSQNGSLSASLSQKIKEAQEFNSEISQEEALELIVDQAQTVLSAE